MTSNIFLKISSFSSHSCCNYWSDTNETIIAVSSALSRKFQFWSESEVERPVVISRESILTSTDMVSCDYLAMASP